MTTHFTILGSGTWGTTIAILLAEHPDHRVHLWCARSEKADHLQQTRVNPHLPDVPLPAQLSITADIRDALHDTELAILAIPTIYIRPTLQRIASELSAVCPMLSLAKGVERETFLRPTEIITQVTGSRPLAVLSGPNHAEEISRGLPTSSVAASEEMNLAQWIQQRLSTEQFRVYTNWDVVGVELAGGLKNIIAIAAGVADGLELGDNAKAALLTRGLVEMTRFGVAHEAEPRTFMGLAGMGDLIATCFSPHGRNRHVGERLGRGESVQAILGSMNMVAEGVYTTQSVYERARHMGIVMPITEAVYNILYEEKNPREIVSELMLRTPKSEKGWA